VICWPRDPEAVQAYWLESPLSSIMKLEGGSDLTRPFTFELQQLNRSISPLPSEKPPA
jgi:hypothetical protein